MSTPSSQGFVMPAEWEPHARCWMAWPCRAELWGEGMEAAQAASAEVAQAIAGFEPVTMVCNPADVAEVSLACGPGIDVLSLPIDDSWLRDTGPTFLVNRRGGLAGVHWRFNAWGGKYATYDKDAAVAGEILAHLGVPRFGAPIVLEGGAIHVDGDGTLLTTEQCVLNPNRNPGLSRAEMERHLKEWLGVRQVIWLADGLEDDETDGHVDNVACFAAPGVVLALCTEDRNDGNYAVLKENIERLNAATDARGRTLRVIEVPQPARRAGPDGRRLAMSYINFYIANDAVIMPAFVAPEDDRAFRILREVFPDRKVVQIPASDIVVGGGGIHCITQQQPAV